MPGIKLLRSAALKAVSCFPELDFLFTTGDRLQKEGDNDIVRSSEAGKRPVLFRTWSESKFARAGLQRRVDIDRGPFYINIITAGGC